MKTKTLTVNRSFLFSLDLLLPVLAFTIPLFISGPQLLTGSLVNCFLFLTAVYSSKKIQTSVVVFPSIAALLNGLLFGKFTPFLAYFIPFIWMGNFLLVRTFSVTLRQAQSDKDIMVSPTNHDHDSGQARMTKGIIISSFLKSLFLFIFAFIFFKLSIVPQIFLTAMGVFQFITAILGGLIFLGINKIITKNQ
ncbi:hypothetical protein COY13_00400 [Candidatus Roizmanbacteria bacterium CG_4_10_14_0_2_um_filter_36_35]|uniref:Uncharacterized protein n=2 Tax=Candidatus Roizmaniibacteriota TaxID=1752723 RepID=A0A2M7UC67_9BACT|nr:MAG: hypothetical protein COV86_02510 [Candidatus Roizmanbacteria bacterium CG11_big_fil_rev_8_21_14_0_20_35_14]PIZ68812.1 MAG: hypothetical protein COY13_00400 [Candidatus Roizmanbacteria bacterium CG_4_10_14_0_2_um_filter_36_35]PJC79851.1 MAG: hypothetical protein CO008_03810 [Candidatus Roizmanbacteria bacterium CG_4_8_14_3_um_filter_36_12]